MSSNKVYSQVNVPFSWELKPGVSKVTHEKGTVEIRHITVNLPPPPSLPRVNDLQSCVLPPYQLQARSSAKKCGNVNKQDDPFVAAYRKCTEHSINGGKIDACKGRSKKNMFAMSCKYSCSVSSDNMIRVSHCLKEKGKEEQKERDKGDAKLTEQINVKKS